MVDVVPPTERSCERCERREVWDDDRGAWVVPDEEEPGRPHCLHEWDINGSYSPIGE